MRVQSTAESENIRLRAELAAALAGREKDAKIALDLTSRLNQLEAALGVVPVGVIVANASGHIVSGNPQVEQMLGHPILHSPDVDSYGEWVSFHEDGRQVESREYPLAQIITAGKDHEELDVNYRRGDGTMFWLRIIGEPIKDQQGNRIGAAVALVNIAEERRLQDQQTLLIGELNHRVKNAFAVVKSIVSQSLRRANVQDGLRETIDKRLDAYASAHAKLTGSDWEGTTIAAVASEILRPIGGNRISVSGPEVELPSRHAMALSMAFYELGTNALKYGSLSSDHGVVELSWFHCADDHGNQTVFVTWLERGGPKPVIPERKGFGSIIIDRALTIETSGTVEISYPEAGMEWRLTMPEQAENESKK